MTLKTNEEVADKFLEAIEKIDDKDISNPLKIFKDLGLEHKKSDGQFGYDCLKFQLSRIFKIRGYLSHAEIDYERGDIEVTLTHMLKAKAIRMLEDTIKDCENKLKDLGMGSRVYKPDDSD